MSSYCGQMSAITIPYRQMSYETLACIMDLADRLKLTPAEAAEKYLALRAKRPADNHKEDAA